MRHEEAVEGGPANPQEFGGLDLVAAAFLEGRRHHGGIEFGDGAPGVLRPLISWGRSPGPATSPGHPARA